MKTAVAIGIIQLLAWGALAIPARAQPPVPVPFSQPAAATARPATDPTLPPSANDDRFSALKEAKERTNAAYTKVHDENMPEVETLLRSNRCQIKRVGGLIDRTEQALRDWVQEEKKYWKVWADVEQERVDGQQKNINTMEAEAKRTSELIESEKSSREELLRRKDGLEKLGKKTEDILKELDELIKDIKESEVRLSQAQITFEDLTAKVRNMNATINARLIEMRQNFQRVEAFGLQMSGIYENKRKLAQDVCNTKKPDLETDPLPKKRSK